MLIALLLAAIGYSFYYVLTFLNKIEYSGTLSMDLVLIIHKSIIDVITSPGTSRLIILSIPPNCQIIFDKDEIRFKGLEIDPRLLKVYNEKFKYYDQTGVLKPGAGESYFIIEGDVLIVKYRRVGTDTDKLFNDRISLESDVYTILLTSTSFDSIKIEVSYGG